MLEDHVHVEATTRIIEAQEFLEHRPNFDSVLINVEQIFNDEGDSDGQDKDITDHLLPGKKDILPSLIEFTPMGWYFLSYHNVRISERLEYELLESKGTGEINCSSSGDILLVDEFWDCECDKDFIHRKATTPTCTICGTSHENQPDSRVNEVLEASGDLITSDERRLLTKEWKKFKEVKL